MKGIDLVQRENSLTHFDESRILVQYRIIPDLPETCKAPMPGAPGRPICDRDPVGTRLLTGIFLLASKGFSLEKVMEDWHEIEGVEVGANRFASGAWRVIEDESEIRMEVRSNGHAQTFSLTPTLRPESYPKFAVACIRAWSDVGNHPAPR